MRLGKGDGGKVDGWGGGRGKKGLTQARREVRSERMCEICMVGSGWGGCF